MIIFIIILIKRRKKKDENADAFSDASIVIPEAENSGDPFNNDSYGSFENPLREDVPDDDPFENDIDEEI